MAKSIIEKWERKKIKNMYEVNFMVVHTLDTRNFLYTYTPMTYGKNR